MSVTVVNRGVWERDSSGNKNTKVGSKQALEETGTIRVVVEQREYTFGPGQSMTFADDGVGIAVAAANGALALADTREGFETGTKRT